MRIKSLFLIVLFVCAGSVWADHDISVPYYAAAGTAAVDGNLGDWGGAQWIAMDVVYSSAPDDITSAKYSLRWSDSENLLYFAVEVVDTQHNMLSSYGSWNGQDDIEVSVDAGNNDASFGSPPALGQQIIFGADGAGGDWVLGAWGNAVGTDLVPEYSVAVNGDVITYEGSVVPYSYYAGWGGTGTQIEVDLAVGTQIGFDIVAVTKLDDGSYGMMTNNSVGGKFQQGASLQTWQMVPEPASMSLLVLGGLAVIRRKR